MTRQGVGFGPMATAPTTVLLTDHYELTMLDAALRSGAAERRCVFEVFARSLPAGRRYGVVAGTGRFLDALEHMRFTPEVMAWLRERAFLSDAALDYLSGWRFGGDIDGYGEGDLFFAGSPILTVEATFAEAVVLETLVLSIFNHDAAIAAAASRMVQAAGPRPVLEAGGRRTHEEAAVAAARAAWLVGFDGSSNLEAGFRYGVPTGGTTAHSFTQVHDDEASAFEAQIERFGSATTFLVDTYEIEEAIRHAVALSPAHPGAVRIDSGDLVGATLQARKLLDELGCTETRIVLSGDLDEYRIADLAGVPADGYLAGTAVVTGSGFPTAFFVYKLVAVEDAGDWRGVEKQSDGKATRAGRKQAYRRLAGGQAVAEWVSTSEAPPSGARRLQLPLVRSGVVVGREPMEVARQRHREAIAELPEEGFRLDPGPPAIPTEEDG